MPVAEVGVLAGGGLSLGVNATRSVARVQVTADGEGLVSQAGLVLLAELADRSGLTKAMSWAMAECGIAWHTHDPGVVLTHLAVAIANGADCLADMAVLRNQPELFDPVASAATVWRAIRAATSVELRRIPVALAQARERVWAAADVTPMAGLTLDFDATLVTAHSDKQDAAPTYKAGFGFYPLGVWVDGLEEPLGAHHRVEPHRTLGVEGPVGAVVEVGRHPCPQLGVLVLGGEPEALGQVQPFGDALDQGADGALGGVCHRSSSGHQSAPVAGSLATDPIL
jgi:hypothetical protein